MTDLQDAVKPAVANLRRRLIDALVYANQARTLRERQGYLGEAYAYTKCLNELSQTLHGLPEGIARSHQGYGVSVEVREVEAYFGGVWPSDVLGTKSDHAGAMRR